MKKIILLVVLVLGSLSFTQAQKFALVDMEYILKAVPAYETANEQLSQLSKKWQKEVETKLVEVQTMYKNYQTELVFMSPDMKVKREEEIFNAVQTLANEKDYQLILDKSSNMSLIFAAPKIDVSDAVLEKLGYSN